MKINTLFLIVFITFCSISTEAQIYKSSFLIGGSVGGSYNSGEISGPGFSDKFTYTQALLNPKVGYFFHKQLAVGIMAEYIYDSHDYDKQEVMEDSSVSYFVGGPFIRYYLLNHIFVEGSFGYGTTTVDKTDKFSVMRGAGGIGYALFINEKVAIEPALKYVYEKRKGDGNLEVDYSRGGVALTLGLQVYLYRNPRTIFKQTL